MGERGSDTIRRPAATLTGHGGADNVEAVTFSAAGTLATGGSDSTVRLWHLGRPSPSPSTTGAGPSIDGRSA